MTDGAASPRRLGIGFIGSGFITRFHIRSMVGVRDADVCGCWSPRRENAEEAAALARALDVGDARAFPSIEAMAADPAVDAVWLCGPNHTRIENLEAVVSAVRAGAALRGLACEKPLARTVAEAKRMRALAAEAGLSPTVIWRTRSSRPPSPAAASCCGAAAPPSPAGRTWRVPPRSTAAPTGRGSGAATCRGAGC